MKLLGLIFYSLEMRVPSFSPHTARTMESFSSSANASTGTWFSIHMVAAVVSIAFSPLLMISLKVRWSYFLAFGLTAGSLS